ncbi:MAG: DUF3160 domain-containing protein [Gammaproteobacteria bacterium]|nr:DUF3160 domain-containing protein [Gammaproteobacteria bacterium]
MNALHRLMLGGCLSLLLVLSGTCSAGQTVSGSASDRDFDRDRSFEGGLFDLYALNRAAGVPNYVTADLVLLAHAMLEQQSLRRVEVDRLQPALANLLDRLAANLDAHSSRESSADGVAPIPDEVTRANREFIAILRALLSGEARLPASADRKRARAELALALDARGISTSPLWAVRMDYGQLQPRGDYAEDPARAAYFRASRYAGLVLLPLRPSRATGVDEARAEQAFAQAVQLAGLLAADPVAAADYATLQHTLGWWFGPPDDLDLTRLQSWLAPAPDNAAPTREQIIARAEAAGLKPRILGGLVDLAALEPGLDWPDVMLGVRLLPTRLRADTSAFQQLVHDRVGAFQPPDPERAPPITLGVVAGQPVKAFPSALELMALLGSDQAANRLLARQATAFADYPEAAREAGAFLANARGREGDQLAMLSAWLSQPEAADPALDDDPEGVRRLQGSLAYWTLQRWQAQLYAKPSYTPIGKGLDLPRTRAGAWIEPAPAVYDGLIRLTKAHLEQAPDPAWRQMQVLLERAAAIADGAVAERALAPEDEDFLNDLDRQLAELIGERDRPLVVDVHASPGSGDLLKQAIGHATLAYHGPAGRPVARGARMTHYEFRLPLEGRLDDAGWAQWLAQDGPPVPPSPWTPELDGIDD